MIQRQAVLDKINEVCFSKEQKWVDFRVSQGSNGQRDFLINYIEQLSSVKPQEQCDDAISREVFEQVMWERDIVIQQLKELGYEFGEKVEPQTTNVLSCCDGCKHFNSRYTACLFCFKRNKEKEDIDKAESEEV